MPVHDPYRLGEKPCKCGRSAERRHCPHCGSSQYYAIKKKSQKPDPISGLLKSYTITRCRACSIYYDDLDWEADCNAPIYTSVYLQQQLNRQAAYNSSGFKMPKGLDPISIDKAIEIAKEVERKQKDVGTSSVKIVDGRPIFKIKGLGD